MFQVFTKFIIGYGGKFVGKVVFFGQKQGGTFLPAKKIFGKKGLKQGVYGRSRVFGFSYAEPHFFVSWFIFIEVSLLLHVFILYNGS